MNLSSRPMIPKWVILVIGLWILIILGCISLGNLKNWQFPTYSNVARIDRFSVCEISDRKSGSNVNITVCGILTTDEVAPLVIYVFQLPEENLVPINRATDEFTDGYFSRIITLPVDSQPGKYEIKVYFKRRLIATKVFNLK